MINVAYEVSREQLEYVEKRLGSLKKETPKVMSRALNKTATNARTALAANIRSMYTVKSGASKKDLKIIKATYSRLEAKIKSEGSPISLSKFKTSSGKTYGIKAQVTKAGSAKQIISHRTGYKAFTAKMKSGHIGVFQRSDERVIKDRAKKYGKNRHTEGLRHFPSLSVPKMLEKAYEGRGGIKAGMKDKINSDLRKNINAQIAYVLSK